MDIEAVACVHKLQYIQYIICMMFVFCYTPFDLISDCPRNLYISGFRMLLCSAEANSPPSYLWTNAVDNTVVEGNEFIADETKHYKLTCTVTTEITFDNGTTQACSRHVYFEVNGRPACIIKSFYIKTRVILLISIH